MNSCYLKLAEHAATQEEREYFSNKIEQARTTLRMIEQRRQTILSVTKEILYQQTDFALLGRAPRTLTQQQVAYTLGIHTSTVSRAIRGKYIQLPRGVFPLYIFFHTSAGVHQKSSISREQVKRQVQQLIIHEDPHQPLRCLLYTSLDTTGQDNSRPSFACARSTVCMICLLYTSSCTARSGLSSSRKHRLPLYPRAAMAS